MKLKITTEPALEPRSLPEVHSSVATEQTSLWKRMFAFSGPAYLISVGYMDPGNWATDLAGGAEFGYKLLWVLVLSNLMAILLQTLSARLGIATQRDLAQACREAYPAPVSAALWGLCEVAIAACDLAEVIGAAIGLKLLFHIPLIAGVLITALDTLLVLWFMRLGIRVIESFILALITIITGCFLWEVWFAHPAVNQVLSGLLPTLDDKSLYIAIGILGATVMPHNLYLHSALVQTRHIGDGPPAKRAAARYNLIDSCIALNGAMVVNAAILILAATVFYKHGVVVTEIEQAHSLLSPLVGTAMASILFAIALLCSGQSSTLTGTLAGQIVMEGFLDLRIRPWLRRLVTRSIAVIPALLVIYLYGEKATYDLLILSQVILSLQLPFAVIPLVQFTGDRRRMGELVSPVWVRVLAWGSAVLIICLNLRLSAAELPRFVTHPWVAAVVFPVVAGVGLLLLWLTLEPILPRLLRKLERRKVQIPEARPADWVAPKYRTILVPLDHTDRDSPALSHAAALAAAHGSTLHLLHIEEGATSQVYGDLASTAEVTSGEQYLTQTVASLREQGIQSNYEVVASRNPREEIVRVARRVLPDLMVMGAHGHKGLKDLVLGTTINAVRHELDIPILVVRK